MLGAIMGQTRSPDANRTGGPGPVAIITGAGRGMGAATAHELAARGYRLAVLPPPGAAEVVNAYHALGVTGSVSSPADLQHLVEATMARYGRIDAVVNSTGH